MTGTGGDLDVGDAQLRADGRALVTLKAEARQHKRHSQTAGRGGPTPRPRYSTHEHPVKAKIWGPGGACGRTGGGRGRIAILGAAKAKADRTFGAWVRQYGLRWFVTATWLQFAVGLWFLASLPPSIRSRFLGGGAVETGLLIVALALAVISLLTIQRWLALGTATILGTVALMVIIRDRLRAAYLASEFDPAKLAVQPQIAVFALFVLILLCGIAVIAWMVWKFAVATTPRSE